MIYNFCYERKSYFIKYVLPALASEFEKAYKDLELVHKSSEAMNVYDNLKIYVMKKK